MPHSWVHYDSVALPVNKSIDQSSHSVVALGVRHHQATDIATLPVDDFKTPDLCTIVRTNETCVYSNMATLYLFCDPLRFLATDYHLHPEPVFSTFKRLRCLSFLDKEAIIRHACLIDLRSQEFLNIGIIYLRPSLHTRDRSSCLVCGAADKPGLNDCFPKDVIFLGVLLPVQVAVFGRATQIDIGCLADSNLMNCVAGAGTGTLELSHFNGDFRHPNGFPHDPVDSLL